MIGQVHLEAGDMREWQIRDHSVLVCRHLILRRCYHHRLQTQRCRIENQIVVGKHYALRITRRAAGIDQHNALTWLLLLNYLLDLCVRDFLSNVQEVFEREES